LLGFKADGVDRQLNSWQCERRISLSAANPKSKMEPVTRPARAQLVAVLDRWR
jgi:hypothetical protein